MLYCVGMTMKVLSPYFLLVLIAGAFLVVGQILMPFLAPLVLAASFAAVLQPLNHRILRFTKGNRDIAALLSVIVTLLCILVPLGFIMTMIGWEVAKLYGSVSDGTFGSTVTSTLREAQGMLPGSFAGENYTEVTTSV